MDKLIFTMLNSMKSVQTKQMANAHEIANVVTPGFKRAFREETNSRDIHVPGALHSRAVPVSSQSNVVDMTPGALMVTGNPMDVYVEGEGALAVVGDDGSELYTRRGDIRIGADKTLVNGRGQVLMDATGGPITIPPGSMLEINTEGQVTMMPAGGGERQQVGTLKIVDTTGVVLRNREDGLLEGDQPNLPVAPEIKVTPKAIEGSSVNAIDSMVRMIELSRQYEMSVNMLKQAREVDSAGASTMRMS